jgi:hypothetical protein
MLGQGHFHVEVGCDDEGMLVTISHAPTNQERSGRPMDGETCAKVQDRLRNELIRTFFSLSDFRFQMGRCQVDGKIGDFYSVEHLPSRRSKSLDTISTPNSRYPHHELLESLLDDLWSEGVLPRKAGA